MMPDDRCPPKSTGTRSTGWCSTAARTRSRGFTRGSRLGRGRGRELEDPLPEGRGVDVVELLVELVDHGAAVHVPRLAPDAEADGSGPGAVLVVRALGHVDALDGPGGLHPEDRVELLAVRLEVVRLLLEQRRHDLPAGPPGADPPARGETQQGRRDRHDNGSP